MRASSGRPRHRTPPGHVFAYYDDQGRPVIWELPTLPPTKEEAPCCRAKALPDGRPVIGFCGPDCQRRR